MVMMMGTCGTLFIPSLFLPPKCSLTVGSNEINVPPRFRVLFGSGPRPGKPRYQHSVRPSPYYVAGDHFDLIFTFAARPRVRSAFVICLFSLTYSLHRADHCEPTFLSWSGGVRTSSPLALTLACHVKANIIACSAVLPCMCSGCV